MGPPSGPTFADFPMDHVFSEAEDAGAPASMADPLLEPVADGVELALKLLDGAERPVVMAGSNLYWGHGENALRELIERRGIPVFLNGLARGCIAADHELFFSRARRQGLGEADVALVVGVPMDFRLGFGGVFGEQTEIVLIDRSEPQREPPREVAVELYGGIAATLRGADRRLRATTRAPGSARCAHRRTSAAPASRPSSTIRVRRCTRCVCTRNSARCSTATRSSSATAATSSPTPAA